MILCQLHQLTSPVKIYPAVAYVGYKNLAESSVYDNRRSGHSGVFLVGVCHTENLAVCFIKTVLQIVYYGVFVSHISYRMFYYVICYFIYRGSAGNLAGIAAAYPVGYDINLVGQQHKACVLVVAAS